MQEICTVTLNPSVDYIVRLPSPMVRGSLNRSRKEEIHFGGKGINVSLVLKTLGIPSRAAGFTAGFTGDALEQHLRALGLQTDFIRVPEGLTRINVKLKDGEETEINGSGPVVAEQDFCLLLERLSLLPDGSILVVSGSAPSSLPKDCYLRLLDGLGKKNFLSVLDLSGNALRDALAFRPFLVKPNHHELGEILGKAMTDDDAVFCGARELQKLGAKNVLVSMAERGALLLDENGGSHRIGCPSGTVVNSTGAGDSMVAGFLAGWLRTGSFETALKLGTAAGSASAFCTGLADADNIEALYQTL